MTATYIIDLTAAEPTGRRNLIKKGKPSARQVARAPILWQAAEGATDAAIAQALHLSGSTVHRPRQRLVEAGLPAALSECPRPGKRPALSGKQEAFLVALACSPPPQGRRRWPMHLLADRLVALRQSEASSPDTVRRLLKKTISTPGSTNGGASPG
jgi:transposase